MGTQRGLPPFQGLPGRLLRHAAVWGGGAQFSFPRMPSSHFSYLRETWPNFLTVNIRDVKSAENMSLSGLILAGVREIAEDSGRYRCTLPCSTFRGGGGGGGEDGPNQRAHV